MNNKMKMNAKTGHLQKRREKRGMAALFAAFFGAIPAFAAADMEDIRSLNLSTLPVLAHSGLGGVMAAAETHAERARGAPVWARGKFRVADGSDEARGDDKITTWDSRTQHFDLGMDFRVNNFLLGAAASRRRSEVDYGVSGQNGMSGKYTHSNTTGAAYFSWSLGATDVWGMAGGGAGTLKITPSGSAEDARAADTSETVAALSVKQTLVPGLAIRADGSYAATSVEKSKNVDAQDVDSARGRLLLIGEHSHQRANGIISPRVELGFRYDTVESELTNGATFHRESTGGGVEFAAGIDYINFATGVTLSVNGRFYNGNDYKEWGAGTGLEMRAGRGGRGLSLRLDHQYGGGALALPEEFANANANANTNEAAPAPRMRAVVGYGFAARGLLTPYAETIGGAALDDEQRILGLRWQPQAHPNTHLAFTLHDARAAMLKGELRF